jgi:ketosteroid isomerase-like protein
VAATRDGSAVSLSAEDRLDILELLARADTAASDRDTDAYLALFSDDAVLDGAQGDYRGKEALREAAGSIWPAEPPGSVHLTLNAIIDPAGEHDGEPAAVARSVLVIVGPGPAPAIVHVARIAQQVQRSGGTWRIVRRSVGASGEAS